MTTNKGKGRMTFAQGFQLTEYIRRFVKDGRLTEFDSRVAKMATTALDFRVSSHNVSLVREAMGIAGKVVRSPAGTNKTTMDSLQADQRALEELVSEMDKRLARVESLLSGLAASRQNGLAPVR